MKIRLTIARWLVRRARCLVERGMAHGWDPQVSERLDGLITTEELLQRSGVGSETR
jgi:mannose/cellobiose epimerase-like protein (N-acyl-D-glucosamine 2-epimerase family)